MSVGAAGNPTVAMVEAAFLHHGLPWRYINMEVAPADLGTAVRGAKAMGFRGFNCSLPHKVSVIEHLDGLGESAAAMGAVNCVVRRGQELIGENTDGKGFLKSLETSIDPKGKSIVLFGAGGAARAVAVELGLAGARRITVVNRSGGRGGCHLSGIQSCPWVDGGGKHFPRAGSDAWRMDCSEAGTRSCGRAFPATGGGY